MPDGLAGGVEVWGGVLWLQQVRITNTTAVSTGSKAHGGGLHVHGGVVHGQNLSLSGATAEAATDGDAIGGGIGLDRGRLELASISISSCTAMSVQGVAHGGGVAVEGDESGELSMVDGTISGSAALSGLSGATSSSGGGAYIGYEGQITPRFSSVIFERVQLTDNLAVSGAEIAISAGAYLVASL